MDFLNLDFLSNLSEQQLGLGGGALLVFSIALGIIKGVIRIFLGIIGLAAGAVAFWFAFKNGDSIASNFVEDPSPWMPLGIGGGAAATAYLGVRHGVGLILKPILGSVDNLKNKKVLAGMLGLGMGGAGLYGGGTASHQVEAMNFIDQQRNGESVSWVTKVLAKSQETWFGKLQRKTDLTQTGARCDLVKLLSIAKFDSSPEKSVNVQSILNEPELQSLLQDDSISSALDGGDFQALFRNEKLTEFLEDPIHEELLQQVDWVEVIK